MNCPTSSTFKSDVLLEVEVPIVSDDVCKAASSTSVKFFNETNMCVTEDVDYSDLISKDMVCAGETGKGFCVHDIGGPLTVKSSSTNQHDLVGVASWNRGCSAVSSCIVFSSSNNRIRRMISKSSSFRSDCLACMLRLLSLGLGSMKRLLQMEGQPTAHRNMLLKSAMEVQSSAHPNMLLSIESSAVLKTELLFFF